MFNIAVKPLQLAPVFLRAINWAQPDDPEKKYPLLGRMRYAWLSEDLKNVKLLLKDGPDSFSEEKPEIMEQIKSHENFVSVDVLKRDPVYLVAEFKVPTDHYDSHFKELVLDDFADKMEMIQLLSKTNGMESLTKDPFVIFDDVISKLNSNDPETLENLKAGMGHIISAIEGAVTCNSEGPAIIKVGEKNVETQTLNEHLDEVIEKKESVMKNAVDKEKYERAAEVRDEIEEVKKIKNKKQ